MNSSFWLYPVRVHSRITCTGQRDGPRLALIARSTSAMYCASASLPDALRTTTRIAGADAKVRIFTPAEELPFAGHPTLGTAYVIASRSRKKLKSLVLDLGVGKINVDIDWRGAKMHSLTMHQPLPVFGSALQNREQAARALGVSVDEILGGGVVSNGLDFLIVEATSLATVANARCNIEDAVRVIKRHNVHAIYVFVRLEGKGPNVHARFFAPTLAVVEDADTGRYATVREDFENPDRKPIPLALAEYVDAAWAREGYRIATAFIARREKDGPSESGILVADIGSMRGGDIVIMDGDTTGPGNPAWSPDGRRLAFVSNRAGVDQIWIAPVLDGCRVGEPTPVAGVEGALSIPTWSPDGARIAFVAEAGTESEVWVASAEGSQAPRKLTDGAGAQAAAWNSSTGYVLVLGTWGTPHWIIRRVDPNGGQVREVTAAVPTESYANLLEFDLSDDGQLMALLVNATNGDVWALEATTGGF